MKQQLLALVAALGLAVGGVTAQAADTVKIGLMAPLTGSWASEGQGMKKIVELLAEQQNAKGGVLGKQIEVVTEDDGGDPRTFGTGARNDIEMQVLQTGPWCGIAVMRQRRGRQGGGQ